MVFITRRTMWWRFDPDFQFGWNAYNHWSRFTACSARSFNEYRNELMKMFLLAAVAAFWWRFASVGCFLINLYVPCAIWRWQPEALEREILACVYR